VAFSQKTCVCAGEYSTVAVYVRIQARWLKENKKRFMVKFLG
jgi:hypothetical protein